MNSPAPARRRVRMKWFARWLAGFIAALAILLSLPFFQLFFPLALGLGAGALHVLSGPDHLAAIGPLALGSRRRPWLAGLVWGLGHTGGVWVVALGALLLRELLPLEWLSSWSERLVGIALIAIGLWGLRRVWHPALSHPCGRAHRPGAAGAVGVLHGLAGSSHFLGVLPALALPSKGAALSYIFAFGLGSIGAMAAFAGLLGAAAHRFAGARQLNRWLLTTCSTAALALGCVWLAL